jgi:hypothetical protein
MRQFIAVFTMFGFLLLVGPRAGAQEQTDREKLKQKAQEQAGGQKDLKERTKAKREVATAEAEDDGGHAGAIAGGIAAVAVVGTVVAKSKGGPDKDDQKETETTLSFGTMDANEDGKLSQDEFLQAMSRGFDASDKNGDGKVTRDEAVAAYGERGGTYFDALDDERSGAVAMEALQNDAREAFRWADANRDGTITADEKTKAAAENAAAEEEQAADAPKAGKSGKKVKKLVRAVS